MSSSGPASVAVWTFVGSAQGTDNFTYTAAPIATGAQDTIVVGVLVTSNLAATINSCTVGGVGMTAWTPGQQNGIGTLRCAVMMYYGVPGVAATANIVANTSAVGGTDVTLLVWKVSGLNATPVDQVLSTPAVGISSSIGPISASANGAIVAMEITSAPKAMIETWSGSEPAVEDTDFTINDLGARIAGFHVLPTTNSSNSFSITWDGSSVLHIGGALSFGP
jgi:hypothetical protein